MWDFQNTPAGGAPRYNTAYGPNFCGGTNAIELLPKGDLIATNEVDHADWNYAPALAYVMRRRFALVKHLLPQARVQRMLEVGFGSGVFMPYLSRRCEELFGIDVHEHVEAVSRILKQHHVRAALSKQDAAQTTFPDSYFDVVIAVSSLEFIEDIDGAAREIARILKPGGVLVAVMPANSRLLDTALHLLTGVDPLKDYGHRRECVVPALSNELHVTRTASFGPVYKGYEFGRLS